MTILSTVALAMLTLAVGQRVVDIVTGLRVSVCNDGVFFWVVIVGFYGLIAALLFAFVNAMLLFFFL